MTDTDAKIEEAKRKIAEASQQHNTSKANQTPTKTLAKEPTNSNLKNAFTSFFKKDEDDDSDQPQAPMEIGMPANVVHEGHIGFDKNEGFKTRNLPPQFQKLFDNLNKTLQSMGVSGITEKEAKFLLRSIPVFTEPTPEDKQKKKPKSYSERQDQFIQDLQLQKKTMEGRLEVLEKELERLKEKLQASEKEALTAKERNAALQLEVTSLKAQQEGASPSDVETKMKQALEEELKTFHAQLKEKDEQISSLTSENEAISSALEQMRIIKIDRERPKEDNSTGVRKMKKKGETVVFSADSKSQIKAVATTTTSTTTTPRASAAIPEAPSSVAPPPPPPPSAAIAPPPPPPNGIPKEPKLKPTPKEKPAPERTSTDGRSALLEAIRGPNKLRHVSEESNKKEAEIDVNDQNVLNIIAKALVARREVIKEDAPQQDDEDDNLEDWL